MKRRRLASAASFYAKHTVVLDCRATPTTGLVITRWPARTATIT
jgi:hypothetical protein